MVSGRRKARCVRAVQSPPNDGHLQPGGLWAQKCLHPRQNRQRVAGRGEGSAPRHPQPSFRMVTVRHSRHVFSGFPPQKNIRTCKCAVQVPVCRVINSSICALLFLHPKTGELGPVAAVRRPSFGQPLTVSSTLKASWYPPGATCQFRIVATQRTVSLRLLMRTKYVAGPPRHDWGHGPGRVCLLPLSLGGCSACSTVSAAGSQTAAPSQRPCTACCPTLLHGALCLISWCTPLPPHLHSHHHNQAWPRQALKLPPSLAYPGPGRKHVVAHPVSPCLSPCVVPCCHVHVPVPSLHPFYLPYPATTACTRPAQQHLPTPHHKGYYRPPLRDRPTTNVLYPKLTAPRSPAAMLIDRVIPTPYPLSL